MARFRPGISNKIIILVFGIVAALYFASSLLIPLTWGIFLALLMRPVSNKMEEKGAGRVLSSTISMLIVLFGVTTIFYFIFSQSSGLIEQIPQMQDQLESALSKIQGFAANKLGVSEQKMSDVMQGGGDSLKKGLQSAGKTLAGDMATTLLHFLLVMVYLFLLLLKRDKYEEFILKYFNEDQEKAKEVTHKTAKVAGEYLSGRLKVMTILAIMYVIAFYAFGLQNALLIVVVTTVLTIIPYVGPLLSGIIPIIAAFLSGMDFGTIAAFSGVVLVIQLIESYVLEPIILGSEVHLSPITIIVAIVAGELLWGISGMILFVPIFSVVRIICAEIDELKPVAFLLSDARSETTGLGDKIKSIFKK